MNCNCVTVKNRIFFRNLLLLFLLGLSIRSLAGVPDSMSYSSDFERAVFEKLHEAIPVDSIDLFIAADFTDSKAVMKQKVNLFAAELRDKLEAYPVSKKVKTIYKEVHGGFLKHYAEQALFNDIISSGDYNCVSATALFAEILEMTGIKYTIKETPTHVYLIADPGQTSFLMESTLPSNGVTQFDTRFRDNYITYLHDNKIISDAEFSANSTEELFKKYYLKDNTISLKQLAGIQYSNKGVFDYNKGLYKEALISFQKAYDLYHSDAIGYMLNNSLINLLDKEQQKKEFDGATLAGFLNLAAKNKSHMQYGIDYFNSVSTELIINHPNESAYSRYFQQLVSRLQIEDDSEIKRMYYFYMGYYDCTNYRYPRALANLKKAYDLNAENVNTRQIILQSVESYLMNDRNYELAVDSMEIYLKRFPFLGQNSNIISYLDYIYVRSISQHLQSDNLSAGQARLKQYDSFLERNPGHEVKPELVTEAYRKLAAYYMRHNKMTEAEQSLRKGIRISPDAVELKGMLRSLISYKGGNYEYPELMDDNKPVKKYLMATAIAKDKQDVINAGVGMHLKNAWELAKIIVYGKEEEPPADIKMKLILLDNNKAEFYEGSEKSTGRWSYNPAKCQLDLVASDPPVMHLIITEISQGELKGLLYEQNNYEESFEVVMVNHPAP